MEWPDIRTEARVQTPILTKQRGPGRDDSVLILGFLLGKVT